MYQPLVVEEDVLRHVKVAEGEAPVAHHGRVRLVGQHPVQQDRKDLALHLQKNVAGIF